MIEGEAIATKDRLAQQALEVRLARITSAAAHSYETAGAPVETRRDARTGFEIGTDRLRKAHEAGLTDELLDLTVSVALHFREDPLDSISAHIKAASEYGEPFTAPTGSLELEPFEEQILIAIRDGRIETVTDEW